MLDGVRRAAAKISADVVTRRSEEVYILTLFKQSLSYPDSISHFCCSAINRLSNVLIIEISRLMFSPRSRD